MHNYTDKAAERLLGRLVPPAAMGEKRAGNIFGQENRGPLGLREDAQLGDAAPALGAVGGAGIGALMGGKRNALLRMLQGAAIGGGAGLGMHWTDGGRNLLGEPAEGLGPIAGGLGLAGLLQLLKEDEEEAKEASAPAVMEQATKQAGFWSEALGGLTSTGVGAGLGGLAGGALGHFADNAAPEGAMAGALAGAHIPNLIGMLLAGTTPTRSTREQAEADPEVLKNLLIPGRAAYNQMKRLGMSIRSPELKQEQLNVSREKRDKNREEAKEASARGELSPVLLKKAMENVSGK